MDTIKSPGENTKASWWFILRQICVSLAVILLNFLFGLSSGAPTVVVPQLRKLANTTEAVSEEMASWITTIVPVAAMFWVLVLVTASHYIGRRKPAIFIALTCFISFVVFYNSTNVMHIFFSQLIQGIPTASIMTISFMIMIEYASVRYQGFFMSLKTASYHLGIWVANAIGTFFHYKYIGVLAMVLILYLLVVFITMPESPYWLAAQKRYDECAVSHRWLMGSGEEAENELNILITTQKKLNDSPRPKMSFQRHVCNNMNILKQRDIYHPIILCATVLLSYHLSGKLVCSVYAIEVLVKMFDTENAAYMTMLTVDGFTVISLYTGAVLTKYLKRRLQFYGITSICATSLFTLAIYMYLIKINVISENIYATIALLIMYTISACAGPICTSVSLVGELFPKKHRTLLITIFCLYSKSLLAISFKMGPYLLKTLDIHGVFAFFGTGLVLCLLASYKYLPETKDKSAQDILNMFKVENSVDKTEIGEQRSNLLGEGKTHS